MSNPGQAITGIAGAVVGTLIMPGKGTLVGLSLGLSLGGALFPSTAEIEKPKPGDLQLPTSMYGGAIPVLYGTRKITGNLIWYGNFQAHESEEEAGGKGGGGSIYTTYTYSVSLAFGLCMGPGAVLRMWEGNEEVTDYRLDSLTVYDGTQTTPDDHIASFVPRPPVWKNLVYVVLKDYPLGNSTYIPMFTVEVQREGKLDAIPSDVTKDILTNQLYGLGLSTSYLDTDIFDETAAYCTTNDFKISPLFDSQMSVLDALQYVITHHDGYVTYRDGLIAHHQLKSEIPNGTFQDENLVKRENDPPLQISKRGSRDYKNKIAVEYTKRDREYVSGTVSVDDIVDIDNYGIKDSNIKLDALTTHNRASKMAQILLHKSLANPKSFSFKLGPECIGIEPGKVFAITDTPTELNEELIRIMTVSESGEDYKIDISAQEEIIDIYDYVATGQDSSDPPEPPDFSGDPLSVVNPLLMELPARYSGEKPQLAIAYSKSTSNSWCGASVYRAYSAAGSYTKIASKPGSGITGTVIAVGSNYIDIELNWDATLSSATSFDDLVISSTKNLCMVRIATGDKYIKFQDADLLAPKQWRLSKLIYDLVGFSLCNTVGGIAVNDKITLYTNIPHILVVPEADKHKTLYYKLPSFNFKGLEQSLADVNYTAKLIDAVCDKPLTVHNIQINGIGLTSSNAITIASGDILLDWMSRNRFNAGANNYTRSDAIIDDSDFKSFEIEVWRNSVLKRSVSQTAKSWTYTTAMQAADGGTGAITFKIQVIGFIHVSEYETCIVTMV